MLKINFEVVLLIITTAMLFILLLQLLIRIKTKSQLHYIFISLVSLLISWNIGAGLNAWSYYRGYKLMAAVYISFIGTCFLPVVALLLGKTFAKNRINYSYKYLFLFIIPMISYIILLTNNYHKLFFTNYSFISNEVTFGKYFIIHSIYSYACIFLGSYYLLYFSVKNSGIFSKQSLLLLTGTLIPLIVNILFTLQLFDSTQLATPIAFSFSIICFYIAILKYDFLGVIPIALQTVVDRISNGFIVIDLEYRIVDFNLTIKEMLKGIINFKRKDNILEKIAEKESINSNGFRQRIEQVCLTGESDIFEYNLAEKDEFFTVEITPIIYNNNKLGTIIMLTNITQHKKDLSLIKEQQQQITDKDRLASLGNLIGGISHNLKTPIMSISGCLTSLEDLTKEYNESIDNSMVTESDHHEIANEMVSNINDIKNHLSYINNALTAIKNQVINPDSHNKANFLLEEVIINVEFLMKYEVKSNLCSLKIINESKRNYKIAGNIGTLVQILNNLISNSIQSYGKIDDTNIESANRKVELIIKEMDNYILFTVRDYGKGISSEIKDKLFKEMVTTKGIHGSGIGLYMSYTKVKAMFNGDMWFESQEGIGTSFYVKVQISDPH
ncbi:sensor histidine kinase [Acetivibrio cellulolyticus]|uniref:sensor histidine kinase n=1 Tax=Acetivibrio cellulolyticus TaxID=35830 RepID=UPI0001E2D11B|nr:histidine kinase N-terminal 7TM domain-containing protein [Acetivibrio cellulolyticus]